jgi:TetR/AcrR family transcriptional repressor of nem operon
MPRAKEFDPDRALDRAMELFWRKGYEATSIQDLVDRMRINRFSLYQTFGSKHDLYLAALDRYRDEVVGDALAAMEGPEAGLAAIRRYFRNAVEFAASRTGWKGCLMTNSAVELAPHDREAAARVAAHLARLEEVFYRRLLEARSKGELGSERKLRELARYLTGAAQGLAVLSKGSPGRRALQGYVSVVLSALERD